MKKILIIEDDESVKVELKELLNNAGYDALILDGYTNMLEDIINIHPDLILLDINIPYMKIQRLMRFYR